MFVVRQNQNRFFKVPCVPHRNQIVRVGRQMSIIVWIYTNPKHRFGRRGIHSFNWIYKSNNKIASFCFLDNTDLAHQSIWYFSCSSPQPSICCCCWTKPDCGCFQKLPIPPRVWPVQRRVRPCSSTFWLNHLGRSSGGISWCPILKPSGPNGIFRDQPLLCSFPLDSTRLCCIALGGEALQVHVDHHKLTMVFKMIF